jgi:endonuclease/exonuclease/phosphatase family metal-dependent hydrolase
MKHQRTAALISTIKSLNPLPDVCCFQECTGGFELQLQGDDWWRKTWAMTKCGDQFAVTGFHYGTMVFVRRELVEKMGFKAKTWFEPFDTTQTGRGLLVLELTPPKSKHPLLIATTHMDYTPQIRATQFAAAIATLSATPTSIFCGDTNIDTYPELEPLLSAGYVDSWLETHSDLANSPDLRAVGISFGTFGLRFPATPRAADGPPRRLDYVMARGMKVARCELVGDELIPKDKWAIQDGERELDLELYVSDHLGVLVDAELA